MRIVQIREPGGPDQLVVAEVEDPAPGPEDLLLRVVAAGVNRADLLQCEGHYPPPPGAPDWPGLEVSGTVLAVGERVDPHRWPVGMPVVALLAGGGYAEQVVVPVGQVLPAPDGIDLVDAAGLPEAVCTAWTNLVHAGRLTAGESVLVHGGSGGVGSVAVQIAAALGARVLTTAGGPERVARCRALGAEVVVDHRAGDVAGQVLAATDGRGVDVVLDVLGAGALVDNLAVLATDGRLVVIGTQRGTRGEVDLSVLMARRATLTGTTLRSRSVAEKSRLVAQVHREVWPMLADGRLRPVVHDRLRLADAARAHRVLAQGGAFGKVLLLP